MNMTEITELLEGINYARRKSDLPEFEFFEMGGSYSLGMENDDGLIEFVYETRNLDCMNFYLQGFARGMS